MNTSLRTVPATVAFPASDVEAVFTVTLRHGEFIDAVAVLEDGRTMTFDALEAAGVDGADLAETLLRGAR
jgi:hypothetical protein